MKLHSVYATAVASREFQGAALCLGNFDGVHLGHQALIGRAKALGRPAAMSFDPHPGKVLSPALAPKLIASQARKVELLAEHGVEALLLLPFTLPFAATSPAQFEAMLFDALGIKAAVVGEDFTYGSRRAGTVATLKTAAEQRGGSVEVVPFVTVDGVVVSSTKVREYILEGRVDAAWALLGRPFDLDGVVVKGQGRGRTIGFPTANIDTVNELKPAPGVYAVQARVQGETGWRGGAANIGVKPTFGGGAVTIEAHLFEGLDLYGKGLRVRFLERLRGEQRFGSAAELAAQIARDVETAKTIVARSTR
ncbi:MAG: riboflavin biosynthesis protein RibF [Myxococcaceae bacterium]|nr:riboflavin biosynthesis protein RibF [Myxococcaceae bacterium]